MTIKLLAVGDLHLGRRPPRLPENLSARIDDFSPATGWERIIDLAVRERVQAVLLAGDVAESTQDYFEALPRLQAGATRLNDAGIPLLAVSGNHDVDILPRLIDQVPEARLLGAGGEWESVGITGDGNGDAEQVTIWGWSFPAPRVTESPIATLPAPPDRGPHLGLLHCDRDQSQSPYAPVTTEQLRNTGFDGWLLGHIHQPDALHAGQAMGYLGSVVGLDAGEPGPRGPWLVEIRDGRIQRLEQRPLAPLRWERLDVDITGATTGAAVATALSRRLEALGADLTRGADWPDLTALRVRLTGECDLTREAIEAELPDNGRAMGLPGTGQIQWFLEHLRIDTRPTIPLSRLAERDDQPGLLARRLLTLQRAGDDPERRALLEAARQHLQSSMTDSRWRQLPGDDPDPESIAVWLRERGQDALRAMLAQEAD
ncbi:metallophosphoesterase family protein [Spiribacter onubensis]|uniref:DNA repair exonuclease n=1 Tax=Spiribacter onubensis TaxID=3122420 RepID=A0ABV3S7P2_9GAMM